MNATQNLKAVALFVALCAAMTSSAQAVIMSSDVISYWKLDGNLLDSATSLPVHNGTYMGGTPVYIAGQSGQALDFTGAQIGDYVTSALQVPSGPKTMVLWMARSGAPAGDSIWAGSVGVTTQRFYLGRHGSGVPYVGAGTTISSTGGAFLPNTFNGQFHMFALVDDGVSSISVYQDGNPTPLKTVAYAGVTTGNTSFEIGRAGGGVNVNGDVMLDDVALFNRQLTTTELGEIFTAGSLAQYFINNQAPEPSSGLLLAAASLFVLRRRRTLGSKLEEA